ncbi:hypothetical protein D9758_003707 [Tetrapyrgos nigripes]|uniref:Endonuclease/exonuclease/phosphatase domain-containing protein n=1 Tax=Tetrapyrgos nigripes TaxID=182062 RepID=A0A8H5GMC6_9AGAR|nr:hypothetical protein D9758_003707 [Tetrapyrgos nigripes]
MNFDDMALYDVSDDEKYYMWSLKMYRYRDGTQRWKHLPVSYDKHSAPNRINLITWNIDFQSPYPTERMQGAMKFLQEYLGDPPSPCVILLQEVSNKVLPYLLEVEWIQRHFLITPTSKVKWNGKGTYGLVTLVEKSIPVVHSSIVHFANKVVTDMERAVLLTDVKLRVPGTGSGKDEKCLVVRIANVHLESLGYLMAVKKRREQLKFCAWIVREPDEQHPFHGGVVAGDFNAIDSDSDSQVTEEGLKDHGPEMELREQFTWGVNDDRGGYPPGRLDKIVYTPYRGFRMTIPERLGFGLTINSRGKEECVSDHCALSCNLEAQRRG